MAREGLSERNICLSVQVQIVQDVEVMILHCVSILVDGSD